MTVVHIAIASDICRHKAHRDVALVRLAALGHVQQAADDIALPGPSIHQHCAVQLQRHLAVHPGKQLGKLLAPAAVTPRTQPEACLGGRESAVTAPLPRVSRSSHAASCAPCTRQCPCSRSCAPGTPHSRHATTSVLLAHQTYVQCVQPVSDGRCARTSCNDHFSDWRCTVTVKHTQGLCTL